MITDESFVDFKCPFCGEQVSFPGDCAGLVRECLNCLEILIVPKAGGELGHRLPIPITTATLRLRRFDSDDLPSLLELWSGSEEEAVQWLERDRKCRLTTLNETLSLGVELRECRRIIGSLGLRFTDAEFREAMVSDSWIEKEYDAELATRAIRALLGCCFRELGLHRVITSCTSSNVTACHLYEQAGLRREGEFVKNSFMNGEWLNTTWFAMLDEEYREAEADQRGGTAA